MTSSPTPEGADQPDVVVCCEHILAVHFISDSYGYCLKCSAEGRPDANHYAWARKEVDP
jgi:hypothetical protein